MSHILVYARNEAQALTIVANRWTKQHQLRKPMTSGNNGRPIKLDYEALFTPPQESQHSPQEFMNCAALKRLQK